MPVAEALDRVLEILRTTELYSPQLGTKDEDPHTNDLVGGLMTVSSKSNFQSFGKVFLVWKSWKPKTHKKERPGRVSLGTFEDFSSYFGKRDLLSGMGAKLAVLAMTQRKHWIVLCASVGCRGKSSPLPPPPAAPSSFSTLVTLAWTSSSQPHGPGNILFSGSDEISVVRPVRERCKKKTTFYWRNDGSRFNPPPPPT